MMLKKVTMLPLQLGATAAAASATRVGRSSSMASVITVNAAAAAAAMRFRAVSQQQWLSTAVVVGEQSDGTSPAAAALEHAGRDGNKVRALFVNPKVPVALKWKMHKSATEKMRANGHSNPLERTMMKLLVVECILQRKTSEDAVAVGREMVQYIEQHHILEQSMDDNLAANVLQLLYHSTPTSVPDDTTTPAAFDVSFDYYRNKLPKSMRTRPMVIMEMMVQSVMSRRFEVMDKLALGVVEIMDRHGGTWPMDTHGRWFDTEGQRDRFLMLCNLILSSVDKRLSIPRVRNDAKQCAQSERIKAGWTQLRDTMQVVPE